MFTAVITITPRQLILEVDFRVDGLISDIERIHNHCYDLEFDLPLDEGVAGCAALSTPQPVVPGGR